MSYIDRASTFKPGMAKLWLTETILVIPIYMGGMLKMLCKKHVYKHVYQYSLCLPAAPKLLKIIISSFDIQ